MLLGETRHTSRLTWSLTPEGSHVFDVQRLRCPLAGRKCSPTARLFHLQELDAGGGILAQYLQWPLPLAGQGPMGKSCRRQTMNNRVQGWAAVPVQRGPSQGSHWARDGGGHSTDQRCPEHLPGCCISNQNIRFLLQDVWESFDSGGTMWVLDQLFTLTSIGGPGPVNHTFS